MTEARVTELASASATRDEFLRGEGFILYTDFNRHLLSQVLSAPPELVGEECVRGDLKDYASLEAAGINTANFGLFAVTAHSIVKKPSFNHYNDESNFGVSSQDRKATADKFLFNGGFADRAFTWHFSAATAAASVHRFVREEKISEEAAAGLTLGDWANMIGSAWFSKLVHQMAFAGNSVYRSFGSKVDDFERRALEHSIQIDVPRAAHNHLRVREQFDSFDERVYLTTELDPATRAALRESMRATKGDRGSIGCPVARRSARLPKQIFDTNPHVAALMEDGILTAREESDGEVVQIDQGYTAIDRTLDAFARQLDIYDSLYGTPIVTAARHLEHRHLQPTDVLWWDAGIADITEG